MILYQVDLQYFSAPLMKFGVNIIRFWEQKNGRINNIPKEWNHQTICTSWYKFQWFSKYSTLSMNNYLWITYRYSLQLNFMCTSTQFLSSIQVSAWHCNLQFDMELTFSSQNPYGAGKPRLWFWRKSLCYDSLSMIILNAMNYALYNVDVLNG